MQQKRIVYDNNYLHKINEHFIKIDELYIVQRIMIFNSIHYL